MKSTPKDTFDFPLLKELRERFLSESAGDGRDYWGSREILAQYDLTFAKRIQWKWESVIRELESLGWRNTAKILVDIGTGTGAAAEAFASSPGYEAIEQVRFHDRSQRALDFTAEKFGNAPGFSYSTEPPSTENAICLLSHIVNELSEDQLRQWTETLRACDTFIWVEPGTPLHSQKLIRVREALRDTFHPLAPCPHEKACGLLGSKKDWCHHFAKPPSEIFQSRDWRKWSETLQIDLRSLPVSYLVMSRKPLSHEAHGRVIGHPRVYTGYALADICREAGVHEEKFLKRVDPAAFKRWKDPVFRMTVD